MFTGTLVVATVTVSALGGCTTAPRSITEINVADKEPSCIRQCTISYSSCVSGGILQNNQLAACHDSYSACVSTCPKTSPDK